MAGDIKYISQYTTFAQKCNHHETLESLNSMYGIAWLAQYKIEQINQ